MWYNGIIKGLLRSPLHRLMSGSTLLITFTGQKSGKVYTTPVNYVQTGQDLLVTSVRGRTWWRNLRGGAPVVVRLQGQDRDAVAEALTEPDEVARGLTAYLRLVPRQARYFGVGLDSDGLPIQEDVNAAAQERVVVSIRLA
jgi:deazaflavin-dependent oxidoreductase (nitroreductase family)